MILGKISVMPLMYICMQSRLVVNSLLIKPMLRTFLILAIAIFGVLIGLLHHVVHITFLALLTM